ncbi:VOC family protein [Thermoleophilia bacterium SCSIO 60948]|nr:VOC family protein [Thermoleophilia bacterium SCSIO 60948]
MPATEPEITEIDHLALVVTDIERTVEFYERVLGMRRIDFEFRGRSRTALAFGARKLNLHETGSEELPQPSGAGPGATDLCLLTETPIDRVLSHLEAEGVAVEHGPDDADGARGDLWSVWFRDPDGNLIEVANEVGEPERS